MRRYIHVAGINRGPCVLKHKYHRHWNHGCPRVFWGSRQLSPFWGGSSWRALSTPSPPANEKTASPRTLGGYPRTQRKISVVACTGHAGASAQLHCRKQPEIPFCNLRSGNSCPGYSASPSRGNVIGRCITCFAPTATPTLSLPLSFPSLARSLPRPSLAPPSESDSAG